MPLITPLDRLRKEWFIAGFRACLSRTDWEITKAEEDEMIEEDYQNKTRTPNAGGRGV